MKSISRSLSNADRYPRSEDHFFGIDAHRQGRCFTRFNPLYSVSRNPEIQSLALLCGQFTNIVNQRWDRADIAVIRIGQLKETAFNHAVKKR